LQVAASCAVPAIARAGADDAAGAAADGDAGSAITDRTTPAAPAIQVFRARRHPGPGT
jgi:hypothetical protein